MKTFKLKITIDEDHVIHDTAIGPRELHDKISFMLTHGISVKLLPGSGVWYPTHRIQEILFEEEKKGE